MRAFFFSPPRGLPVGPGKLLFFTHADDREIANMCCFFSDGNFR
jgi:hypothetical protein